MPRSTSVAIVVAVAVMSIAGTAAQAAQVADGQPREAMTVSGERVRNPSGRLHIDPYGDVSEELLLEYLVGLTSIRAFAVWRNSASLGEAEAMDWGQEALERVSFLAAHGLGDKRGGQGDIGSGVAQ